MRFPVEGEGLWATVRAATVAMAYRYIGLEKNALCSAMLMAWPCCLMLSAAGQAAVCSGRIARR